MLNRLFYAFCLFTTAAVMLLAASLLSTPTQAAIPHNDIEICTDVIRRGDFEGSPQDVSNEWTLSDPAEFTDTAYLSDRGVLFAVNPGAQSALSQNFNTPISLSSTTMATLQLKKAVDLIDGSDPNDEFYVELRRVSDDTIIAGPLLLADGQDRTTESSPIPDFDPYVNSPDQWTDFSQDLFQGINPGSLLNEGDEVRIYFYAPPGDASVSTNFYLDNVSLTFCTNIKEAYLPIILKTYDPSQQHHSLNFNKVASTDLVQPTDLLTYTLQYSVTGNQPAPALTLIDSLPNEVTYQSCTGGLACSESNGTITWNLGNVMPDTGGVVTTVVQVNDQFFATPVLTNTAILSDTSGQLVSDTITTDVQTSHTLSITKTASSDSVQLTDLLTYTLQYSVNGNQSAPGLTLVDNLPEDVAYQDCTGGVTCNESNGTVTWVLGDVMPGTNGVVTTVIQVNNQIFTNPILTNTAILSDASGLIASDTITTAIQTSHTLSVSKTASADWVQPTELLTYTLSYQIDGTEPALDLILTDNLPEDVIYQDCMGGLTCSESNGTIIWNLGDVLPGTNDVVTTVVRVNDQTFTNPILTNTATLSDASGLTASDTVTTTVQTSHTLSITKTASSSSTVPGGLLTYNIYYGVFGNEQALDLTLVDTIPPSMTVLSCDGGLTCGESNGQVTWHLGDVAPTTDIVTMIAQVDNAVISGTTLTNQVSLTDTTGLEVIDAITISVTDGHELSVSQTAVRTGAPIEIYPYNFLTYTIRYTVTGNEMAPDLTLVDTLPQSTTYISCSGGLTCSEVNGEVIWDLGDALPNTTGIITLELGLDRQWTTDGTALHNTIVLTDTTGEIVTDTHILLIPRDIAILFDMSGSMQFDTTSYGFYEPFGDGSTAWYNIDNGTDYPNPDYIHRIPIDHLPTTDLSGNPIGDNAANTGQMCWRRDGNSADHLTFGSGGDPPRYVVIEAELYSRNTSLLAGPYRQPGQGYWAVQHSDRQVVTRMMYGGSNYTGATPILDEAGYQGSWITHNPFVTWVIQDVVPFGHSYTLNEVRANPNDVPSLEYDFITATDWEGSSNDDTRIWIRAQGGYYWWVDGPANIYWAVYEYSDLYGVANGNPVGATPLGTGNIERTDQEPDNGVAYGGADSGSWSWVRLNSTGLDLDNGTRYTLKIWAGQSGYDIDQIVIGSQNSTAFTNNYSGGETNLDATSGSAFRQACNRCNPIYGLTVDQADCLPPNDNGASTVPQDNYDLSHPDNNPLYSGYQPIRGAKESAKYFIRNLNPQFDQVGVVAYSSSMNTIDGWTSATPSQGMTELRCLKKEGSNCFSGASPISYTEVLQTIERLPPSGGTNIAQGMLKGLEMLGVNVDNVVGYDPSACADDNDHCSRGGAAHRILIIMTDGVPNERPNNFCDDVDLYQPNTGNSSEDSANDCVMYYAILAANNNITIYTVGLSNAVDHQLLLTVAEASRRGAYYAILSPTQLDDVFDAILEDTQ